MFSLPDWAFYPIAALAVTAMVGGALSYGDNSLRSREEILTDGVVFEGDSLNAITLGNGLSAQILRDGEETYARIDAVRGPFDGMQSAGAFFALSPAELEAIQGRRVRVRFTVRSAPEFGAAGVRLNLFVPGVGQNAGRQQALSPEFESYTLEINPPSCVWEFGFLGVWPDWAFEHNTIDLERVELTPLDVSPNC
jgi:hypothetical protein